MTSRSQPMHRQFKDNTQTHSLACSLAGFFGPRLLPLLALSSLSLFFGFAYYSFPYSGCCCWLFHHAIHRISVCFFESQRHIDTHISISHNRIQYVYISIFMNEMLKFPISVLVVSAFSARTLSFHFILQQQVLNTNCS